MASIGQHKRMAMGEKVTGMKKGGSVAPPKQMRPAPNFNKSGIPQSPITTEKATNGLPGMKKGGKMPC